MLKVTVYKVKPVDVLLDDGEDMIVERKRVRWGENDIMLRTRSESTVDNSGVQVWRAAFLLGDFVMAHASQFTDETVVELGCGVGFVTLVLSSVAKLVIATDSDVDALSLAETNLLHNLHGACRLRQMDWNCHGLPSSSAEFGWSNRDINALRRARILVASDVFYDDDITEVFLSKLCELMTENPNLVAFVAIEKRAIFSAEKLNVVHLGYDIFRANVCNHTSAPESLFHATEPHVCAACNEVGATPRFLASQVALESIPQVFEYDRQGMLELWCVRGLVQIRGHN
ncbi:methyltransferase-like protein 22-like [Achlya hypogyna]|uniref:Methyltransferase-like protein 22-like n=1 Tax=Achlya hypogyna TaxID=1202772 RepID=A0A1V9YH24_ACHHY|nr:methyltransferase-like protein 22-like [Achlya hypogyna]